MANPVAIVNGQEVTIGDTVGFKSDVEQYGKIISIFGPKEDATLTLGNNNGFRGDYIKGQTVTTEYAEKCWI